MPFVVRKMARDGGGILGVHPGEDYATARAEVRAFAEASRWPGFTLERVPESVAESYRDSLRRAAERRAPAMVGA